MNKEEIKKAIKVALNETCKECYFPKRKCTSCVRDNRKKIKKHIKELEQKESILDKVTDKLKEDIKEFDKLRKLHEMYSPSEERLSSKYFYALKLLNIIEGEKK